MQAAVAQQLESGTQALPGPSLTWLTLVPSVAVFWDTHNSCPSVWGLKISLKISLQLLTWTPLWHHSPGEPSAKVWLQCLAAHFTHTQASCADDVEFLQDTHGIESEITQKERHSKKTGLHQSGADLSRKNIPTSMVLHKACLFYTLFRLPPFPFHPAPPSPTHCPTIWHSPTDSLQHVEPTDLHSYQLQIASLPADPWLPID